MNRDAALAVAAELERQAEVVAASRPHDSAGCCDHARYTMGCEMCGTTIGERAALWRVEDRLRRRARRLRAGAR